ncbi:MAG: Nif3-like dinuclear metal center hexameric protein [Clostridia bacterium]|nr:Nif3-like dinuclear metal center hexameric protein [Clostridia bacterium]
MTVRDIIDEIIKKTGVDRLPDEKTCDKLMSGSLDNEVTKVVSTFMATVDVIKKAAEIGAEMIITHEPTWFTGADDTSWLQNDEVYKKKKELIEKTGVTIWRFHDHMHFDSDDGIFRGFDDEMDWKQYRMPPSKNAPDGFMLKDRFDGCYQIPKTSLKELSALFKSRMDMDVVQIIGDPEMPVERVGVLPGGGSLGLGVEHMPMDLMRHRELDVLICGEILEWTLPAYVRDAYQMGMNKAILVLGHERSEEPGMKHLGKWMESFMGGIPVVFVDSEEPFIYL